MTTQTEALSPPKPGLSAAPLPAPQQVRWNVQLKSSYVNFAEAQYEGRYGALK
jgi:hypothetical protein